MQESYQHQGLGRDLQKELLGRWYHRLARATAEGTPSAYRFIKGRRDG